MTCTYCQVISVYYINYSLFTFFCCLLVAPEPAMLHLQFMTVAIPCKYVLTYNVSQTVYIMARSFKDFNVFVEALKLSILVQM